MQHPPTPPPPANSPVPQRSRLQRALATLGGAVTFYTCIPLPATWQLNFSGIAAWAPIVGLAIGGGLSGWDAGLAVLGLPGLTRSALVVVAWVALTGGLHLDGAIDSADGLAVLDPAKRLEVMSDSRTGAFGTMAGIALLLLKTAALSDLTAHRWVALLAAAAWGRWAQLWAIARYPYLKPTGKGAFHKAAIRSGWSTLPSLLVLVGLAAAWSGPGGARGSAITLSGGTIALSVGAWFNHRLGGQTGDTYGAIVEWTEALLLCGLTGWLV